MERHEETVTLRLMHLGKAMRITPTHLVCALLAALNAVSNLAAAAEAEFTGDGSRSSVALTQDALYQKMLALDTAMFDSFNKCADPAEFKKHAAFFDKNVEFYHDLGGVTLGVDALMADTKKNVCGKFRRELDVASFRVFPIQGYGAMAIGTHRFCHTATTCEGVGEFTTVWREKDGVWQVTRALSYAHRSLDVAASDTRP